jgi:membrane protein implicated in regulation of membrane protease activity
MRKKKYFLFATFEDFDKAIEAVGELQMLDIREMSVENIELYSPIEHPEVEEFLGDVPQPIQRFSFFGGLAGAVLAFLLVAAAGQAMFTVQPQGGKAVIPMPPAIVLMFEGTMMFGVLSTLLAFFIYAGIPRRLKKHYNQKVSEDQIGIEVQVKPENSGKVREIFETCAALEIREVTQ